MGVQFVLSGVREGEYVFPQNPEEMNIRGFRSKNNVIETLVGENVFQRPLLDEENRIMKWRIVDRAMYDELTRYGAPDSNGDLPVVYFWDGNVGEFQGTPVNVLSVYGEPLTKNEDKWTLEVQFKPYRF